MRGQTTEAASGKNNAADGNRKKYETPHSEWENGDPPPLLSLNIHTYLTYVNSIRIQKITSPPLSDSEKKLCPPITMLGKLMIPPIILPPPPPPLWIMNGLNLISSLKRLKYV